jgi:hypothetical protein
VEESRRKGDKRGDQGHVYRGVRDSVDSSGRKVVRLASWSRSDSREMTSSGLSLDRLACGGFRRFRLILRFVVVARFLFLACPFLHESLLHVH